MEGIEQLELFEVVYEDKKIRIYLPEYTDILNSLLTKEIIESLIQERKDAKEAKNFAEADTIRKILKNRGIDLVDHRDRATTWAAEDNLVLKLEFDVPKKIPCKMSNENATYLSSEIIKLYSHPKYGRRVSIDIDETIDSFNLATNFTLYIRGEKQSLVNTWDEEIMTMILHRKIEESDDVVFWYRD